MLCNIKERIDLALLGSICTLVRANKLLQCKIKNCHKDEFNDDERLGCLGKDLEDELTLSTQRLERIEDKAMGTTLGVAVAIGVFGATSGLLSSDGLLAEEAYLIQVFAAVLLIVAMLYLLASGLLALCAYKVGQVFRPELVDRMPVAEERHYKVVLVYCIEQNQRTATMRSNKLSASFTCLRNGLVVVFMLAVLVVVVAGILR